MGNQLDIVLVVLNVGSDAMLLAE